MFTALNTSTHPRTRLALLTLGMLAAAGASLPAAAADTVAINVTANLIGNCSIAPGGLALDIGEVAMTDLANAGDKSRDATGILESKGCEGVTKVTMNFGGTPSSDAGYDASHFMPKAAEGVAIALEASDDGTNYKAVAPNTSIDFTPKASGTGWPFKAHLVRTSNSNYTAGDAGTDITATITYL